MSDLFTTIAQQLVNGVVTGCLYVLVALGLTLIYSILNQINFAHADFVTLSAFAAYFTVDKLGGSYLFGIAAALATGALLGLLLNAAIFAPLRRHPDELVPLIATIGVSIFMENAQLAAFGPIPYQFDSPFAKSAIHVGRIFFTAQSVLIVAVAGLTIAVLYAFIRFAAYGKALRAVAQDRETAGLMGINTGRVLGLTVVIASALAGLAGALLGPVLVLTPFAGATVIVKAFAIVVIGGFGNFEGTILAGLLVGIIESFTTQFLNSSMTDLVVFALLLLVLAVRPTGLIAERRDENV